MHGTFKEKRRYTAWQAGLDFALAFTIGYTVVTVVMHARGW